MLRSCLKTGRYALYDEAKVLQERSDKRQRQRWVQAVSSPTAECLLGDVCDFWDVSQADQVVRVHQVPRYRMFSPVGVLDCPVDLGSLELERQTFGKDTTGKTWHHRDFWPGSASHAELTKAWVGKTVFRKKKVESM